MNRPFEEHVLVAALDEAADFVVVTDDTPIDSGGPYIAYVNRAFLMATGYEARDVLGKPYSFLASPRNAPGLMESIARTIAAGGTNYRESLALRRDGSDFWIEFVGKPFVDDEGRHYRLIIGRDISERRRSLAQIALLFAATEQSSDAIALYEARSDGMMEMTYENEVAYRRGNARLIELWHEGNGERHPLRAALERGEEVREFFAEFDRDGAPVLIEFHARAIRNEMRLEAIVTLERTLTASNGTTDETYESRLLRVAALLTALAAARSHAERLAILRAILLDAFGAEVAASPTPVLPSVSLDAQRNCATFNLRGQPYTVTWERPLESTALTALRFCLETVIEQERLRGKRDR